MENYRSPPYRKLQPLISAFIKSFKLIFEDLNVARLMPVFMLKKRQSVARLLQKWEEPLKKLAKVSPPTPLGTKKYLFWILDYLEHFFLSPSPEFGTKKIYFGF